MTYRKTWFSYVLWVIYTMLCAVFLVFAGNYVCVSYLAGTGILSGRMIQACGFLAVPAAAAVYWIIRGISGRIRRKYAGKETARRIAEVIAVWAIFALGIFLRIECVLTYIQQDASGGGLPADMAASVNGMEYFDMAVIREGGSLQPLAYGGSYLYVLCLSFILTFLGNKIVSAILFQVILQIAGLVLAYAVTRRAAGVLPACTVLLYLSCSASYLEMLKNLGPECLFFVLYLIAMLAAFSYAKGYCAGRYKKIQVLIGAAAVGVMIGLLSYLDLAAVTAVPVMAAAAIGKKRNTEDTAAGTSSMMNGMAVVMAVLACAVGFLILTGIVSLRRRTDFTVELENWAALHIGNTQTFGFKPLYPYSLDMIWFGVLAALAAFLVFEFFRSGREQNYMLWILLCILAAPTPLAVFGVQPFGLISMYIWGVLAGLGLQNCMFGGKARLMQKMIMEINQAVEEAELAEENEEPPEENVQPEESMQPEEDVPSEESVQIVENVQPEEGMQPEENVQLEESMQPEENVQPEESMQPEENVQPEESMQREEDMPPEGNGNPARMQLSEEMEDGPKPRETEEEAVTAEAVEAEVPSKPRYLENPLPLPKKHVRRQMDYQYAIEEKDMKFDVDVRDDDDFDL